MKTSDWGLELVLAFTGPVLHEQTRWTEHRVDGWVLDVICQGEQWQRVNHQAPFLRPSGRLALYAPSTVYHERQDHSRRQREAYVIFKANHELTRELQQLTMPTGYCHIDDGDELVLGPLQRLGKLDWQRSSALNLQAHGLVLQMIGLLATAHVVGTAHRRLAPTDAPGQDLLDQVEIYLRRHIHAPVQVPDLAAAVGMSESAFAHTYPKIAGETPYQSILRSKITAAKHLLLAEGLSVQETARLLGFSTAFNFSRTFKRVVGCAPRDYLAQHSTARS